MKQQDRFKDIMKSALNDNEAMLRDEQWDRLASALDKKGKKRGFIGLFGLIGLIVIIGSAAIATVVYNFHSSNNKQNHNVAITESHRQNWNTKNETNQNLSSNAKTKKTNTPTPIVSKNTLKKNPVNILKSSNSKKNLPRISERGNFPILRFTKSEMSKVKIDQQAPLYNFSQVKTSENSLVQVPKWRELILETPEGLFGFDGIEAAAVKDLKTKKELKKLRKTNGNRGMYFSLGLGPSFSYGSIAGFDRPEVVHRDFEKVFDMSSYQSYSARASLIMPFKKGLGLRTGAQWRRIERQDKVDYVLDAYPFRNADFSIRDYIVDSTRSIRIQTSEKTTFEYILVPLEFNCDFAIGSSSSISIHGGPILSFSSRVKGTFANINELKVQQLKRTDVKSQILGFSAGVSYQKAIWKNLGFGAGLNYQTNGFSTNIGYTDMQVRLKNMDTEVKLLYWF